MLYWQTQEWCKLLEFQQGFLTLSPFCSEIYVNPNTGDFWQPGEFYKREIFADTLEKIAKNGPDEFYNGETGLKLVADIKAAGGIITMEDLDRYESEIRIIACQQSYFYPLLLSFSELNGSQE